MDFLDRLICEIDIGLRVVFVPARAARPMPVNATDFSDSSAGPTITSGDRIEAARLMRVNHTGEVCAQALYQGQALVAQSADVRNLLLHASAEERDHLAWCETRLTDLGGMTSLLNPLFYAGSFSLGVVSGMFGDKWSMGFLVETERQVEMHLGHHLNRWPPADMASRAVLEAMQAEEVRHGQAGKNRGATTLPGPVRRAMRAFSRMMTATTYWI